MGARADHAARGTRQLRLRRLGHPRRAPSRPRCGPGHVDPPLLPRALAHGALRARPARDAARRDDVRGRARRRGLTVADRRLDERGTGLS